LLLAGCGGRNHVLLFPGVKVAVLREVDFGVAIGKSIGAIPSAIFAPGLLFSEYNDGGGIWDVRECSRVNNFETIRSQTEFWCIRQELIRGEVHFNPGFFGQIWERLIEARGKPPLVLFHVEMEGKDPIFG